MTSYLITYTNEAVNLSQVAKITIGRNNDLRLLSSDGYGITSINMGSTAISIQVATRALVKLSEQSVSTVADFMRYCDVYASER